MPPSADDPFDGTDAYLHGHCAFSPETLGLQVVSSRDAAPFNKPALREVVRTFPIRGRFAHELDHLLRVLGTSWGLIGHVMQGRLLNCYLGVLGGGDLRAALAGGNLAELTGRCRREGAAAAEVVAGDPLARRLHVLTREAEARRVWLGFKPFGPLEQLSDTFARLWGVAEVPTSVEDLFPHPPNRDHPGAAITAASLLESLGILKESVYAVEHDEAADGDVVRTADRQYTFALSYARAVLADLFDWEFQPVELEAALNLALWPPVVPAGVSASRPWRWEDLEPGHRYRRVIDWLAARGQPLTNHDTLTDAGRDELFAGFFREAAAHFHWPTPDELAATWLAHLDDVQPWGRSRYAWWCLGERRLRTSYARHLLGEARRHPYVAWFTSAAEEALRPTFSHVVYDDMLEIPEQHCDASGRTLSGRLESYVFLGMLLVLGYRTARESDKEVLEQHLRLMPQFIDPGAKRETAQRNCSFLGEQPL